jgi:hypothetical protein
VAGSKIISLGLILVIILVISLFGYFSGRFAEVVPHFVRASRNRRSIIANESAAGVLVLAC